MSDDGKPSDGRSRKPLAGSNYESPEEHAAALKERAEDWEAEGDIEAAAILRSHAVKIRDTGGDR
ncbi:hypothetical protein [Halarchaeum nitratireducens]|uniref:Uncharacterized protein n=1 Tax=Halarchaeum nitratireducens TaxID=489913 RepID=A0A830GEM0_9EURY|nr:hypothetical protein [Halarchaeum nitratireducens]GGN26926.1 hypothetical protein GCM10009021_31780 [Halarchaeum nitratireducens]